MVFWGVTVEKRNLTYRLTIIVLLILSSALVSIGVQYNLLADFDNFIGDFIHSFRSEGTSELFKGITFLGDIKLLVPLMIVVIGYLLRYTKQRSSAFIVFFSIAGTVVLQDILKEFFQRQRPEILHIIEASGYSFPSGHTIISTAFYWVLGTIICKHLKSKSKYCWYIPFVIALIIFSIGVSRIYFGIHYPSDVLAGFLVGGFWANVCLLLPDISNMRSTIKDQDAKSI